LRQNCKVLPAQPASAAARYVYGLGLVALTMQPETFLRQGCLLVADGESEVRDVMRRYALADQSIYDALSAEYGFRTAA